MFDSIARRGPAGPSDAWAVDAGNSIESTTKLGSGRVTSRDTMDDLYCKSTARDRKEYRMICKTNKLVALMLAGALALQGAPTVAYAVTSAELREQADAARADLAELGSKVQALGEDLHETQYQLGVTEDKIEETEGKIVERQAELKEAQEVLGKRVSTNYKTGGVGLVSIILESTSYEELVSNFYYANKIVESDAEVIQHVKDVRAKLEEEQDALAEQQAEQQQLLAQQTKQKEKLEAQEAEQAAYVENLDAQVAAKVEEERQAELERQRREAEAAAEAARKAAEEAARREAEEARRREQEEQQQQQQQTPQDDGEGGETPVTPVGPSTGSSSLTQSQRNTIIAAAYSQIGVPYSLGTSNPGVSFDCSGFAMYCYAQAGISLPHSSVAQSYTCTPISYDQLQPGDLVFWIGTGGASTGGSHVAIYLGGGNIIHANYNGVEAIALYDGVTGYGTI